MKENRGGHLKILREKIIMRGAVEPLTPLHIGWQRSFDLVSSDAPVIKDPAGNPFIPGSSFKGILRSFIEGFLSGAGINVCHVTDNNEADWCVKTDMWDDREFVLRNACPVCTLFGSSFMGSKLKIKDMLVKKEEWHEAFLRIRDGIAIDRESKTTKHQGKYDFEVVSPGIQFNMEIYGDNLTEEEKGMIFSAFQLISRGFGSIGGSTSRGTGKIKITVQEIEILDPKKFFVQYSKDKNDIDPLLIRGSELETYIKEKIDKFMIQYQTGVEYV